MSEQTTAGGFEDPAPKLRSPLSLAGWALFGILLFGLFVGLGTWQVHRESWKLNLIATVNARVHAEPVAPPGPTEWPGLTSDDYEYLHVTATGHYLRGKQTFVHASTHHGRGYWVMTPMKTQQGFIVLINRGFVKRSETDEPAVPVPAPKGQVTVTGLLRTGNPDGLFMRPNDPKHDRWYSRDVNAIAAARGLPGKQTAPYYVSADGTRNPNEPPIGGLTKIHFRNAHVIYAITWYGLALLVVIAAVLVVRFELHNRRKYAQRQATEGED